MSREISCGNPKLYSIGETTAFADSPYILASDSSMLVAPVIREMFQGASSFYQTLTFMRILKQPKLASNDTNDTFLSTWLCHLMP